MKSRRKDVNKAWEKYETEVLNMNEFLVQRFIKKKTLKDLDVDGTMTLV
jgi:hypothetical protein